MNSFPPGAASRNFMMTTLLLALAATGAATTGCCTQSGCGGNSVAPPFVNCCGYLNASVEPLPTTQEVPLVTPSTSPSLAY
jgi:hypothetical protein